MARSRSTPPSSLLPDCRSLLDDISPVELDFDDPKKLYWATQDPEQKIEWYSTSSEAPPRHHALLSAGEVVPKSWQNDGRCRISVGWSAGTPPLQPPRLTRPMIKLAATRVISGCLERFQRVRGAMTIPNTGLTVYVMTYASHTDLRFQQELAKFLASINSSDPAVKNLEEALRSLKYKDRGAIT